MVRRIGFGQAGDDRVAPVRRRGAAPSPAAEEAPDSAARQAAQKRKQDAKAAGQRPPRPWIKAAPAPEAETRRSAFSFGKLIFLAFFWMVLIRWALASYGGLRGAFETFRGAAEGWIDPIPALFPAIMPLAVGLFVTSLVMGRSKKKS